jgi:16S rRNA (guanine(966)-N(2))-methyltransferase RsmD
VEIEKLRREKIKSFKTPIISGKYKGKQILIPSVSTTRSSKSILRESLFNTIAFDVVDSIFVEMFAGSGSIGLEALSRGAKEAIFVERDRGVYRLLKENIKNIAPRDSTAYNGDIFELFDIIYRDLKRKKEPTILYLDPPFNIREGMEDIYKRVIDLISKMDGDFIKYVIVEHLSSVEMPKEINKLELTKFKKFGKSALSYYRLKGENERD